MQRARYRKAQEIREAVDQADQPPRPEGGEGAGSSAGDGGADSLDAVRERLRESLAKRGGEGRQENVRDNSEGRDEL